MTLELVYDLKNESKKRKASIESAKQGMISELESVLRMIKEENCNHIFIAFNNTTEEGKINTIHGGFRVTNEQKIELACALLQMSEIIRESL